MIPSLVRAYYFLRCCFYYSSIRFFKTLPKSVVLFSHSDHVIGKIALVRVHVHLPVYLHKFPSRLAEYDFTYACTQ